VLDSEPRCVLSREHQDDLGEVHTDEDGGVCIDFEREYRVSLTFV